MIVLLLDRPFKSFLHDGALVAVGVLSAAVDAREAVARRPREGPLPPRVPQRLLLAVEREQGDGQRATAAGHRGSHRPAAGSAADEGTVSRPS